MPMRMYGGFKLINIMHPTRIFKTPEELLAAWEEYKAFLKKEALNWPKIQYVGKDGIRVEDYPILPITQEGFEVYYFKKYGKYIHQYFKNQDSMYNDFLPICSHIAAERRNQQITGGMLGYFNPSITQRLNGLKEQLEQTNIEQPLFPDVSKDNSNK